MELVSIIVPVYNVEKYLPECLDSILASTYTNLEVIVVDDGSPDNCPQICDEYAQKDPRIRVIHQENQGLVGARNSGLAAATGKYIAFVDSDDAVSPVMYEQLIRAIEETDADMAACEYTNDISMLVTSSDRITGEIQKFDDYDGKLSVLTCAPSIRSKTWTSCYVWNKLYRRDLIQSHFRKECLMCEDLRFNWDYILNCRRMIIVPAALHFYRLNEDSITGKYKKQKNNVKMVANGVANAKLWAAIANESPMRTSDLRNYLRARAAYTAHGALWRVSSTGEEKNYSAYVTEARTLINSNCTEILRDKETYSPFLRCMCWMCCNWHWLWRLASKASRAMGR